MITCHAIQDENQGYQGERSLRAFLKKLSRVKRGYSHHFFGHKYLSLP